MSEIGIPNRDLAGGITPNKRSTYWQRGRYLYHKGFAEQPVIYNEGDGSTAPTANATDIDAVRGLDYYLGPSSRWSTRTRGAASPSIRSTTSPSSTSPEATG